VTDWPSYNRSLVRRGEILFSYDFLDGWDMMLAKMNENKNGRKFIYPDSLIFLLLVMCEYTFICRLIDKHRRNNKSHRKKLAKSSKSYGHICKRVNKLNDGTASI